ncbi:disulfide bond formation protein B [Chromobacterium phragmitis]|uniref:Disulfide bond formation protein B n=1 Tax=Chromobacterium phragmitis TaxID=2202141 RepID=A0A344UF82_9NEIS|nr:disulfide bond formation protein B [Chromobacterium phragmitis]AXE28606.1 disulfide bond formation protein B [Chromobacterium phragmitis]AXE33930.1 disulfide bond formation protein B [Chromobacterium phragmitis]
MGLNISNRQGFLLVAAACAGAIGFALFAQYQLGQEPCPLCILQRIGVMAAGALALLAALHNPGRAGARAWGGLVTLASLAGMGVSLRQLWLQSLPADQVPQCGPGLEFLMESFPLWEVLSKVLKGSGECAEIHGRFLGMTMPFWVAVFFAGVIVWTLWLTSRRRG